MPKKYKDCVRKVQAQGKSKSSAHAICTKANAGNIKKVRKQESRRKK